MSAPQTARSRRERRLADRATRGDPRRGDPRPTRRRPGLGAITAIGLVGGLAVIVIAIVLGTRPSSTAPAGAATTVAHAPAGVAASGFVLGRADAPVTIDLYEDFQCPVCETWGQSVFPSLVTNELAAGTVKIAFHDMAFLGPESIAAAKAAQAAEQQGRFWDMWATLYANQGRENSGAFSNDRLIAMATQLGLDTAKFQTDMASAATQAAVDASRAAAGAVGVTSTPTLVIAGQAYVGVRPYSEIAAAIAAAAK
jgi:protein-disulfide isomerase